MIRLLAFAQGHRHQRLEDIHLPSFIERTLWSFTARIGARLVVLDIDHAVRKNRLCRRQHRNTIDYFDRYMGRDPVRSERIEAVLVWLATTFLGAIHIINDNLRDGELLACLPKDHDRIRNHGEPVCIQRRDSCPSPMPWPSVVPTGAGSTPSCRDGSVFRRVLPPLSLSYFPGRRLVSPVRPLSSIAA